MPLGDDVGDGRRLGQNAGRRSPREEEDESPLRQRHVGALEDEGSGDEGAAWPYGKLLMPGGDANRGATVGTAQAVPCGTGR